MQDSNDIHHLKDFIEDKFSAHEELEALRFQRIDELITTFSNEISSNERKIEVIHTRVNRIDTKIKTVQGVGTTLIAMFGTIAAWMGINGNR